MKHYSDLAEEVARFHGYDAIPTTLQRGETTRGGYTPEQKLENRLGALCRTCGYSEIITYSFISPTYYDNIGWAKDEPLRNSLKILNPLGEDTSIMRTTTLPSMLEILTRNYNYRNQNVRLYEIGKIYLPNGEDGLAHESKMLTLGAYGEDMDFFCIKGVVETILSDLRVHEVTFVPCTSDPSYHTGRCAMIYAGEALLGVVGQIHPTVARNYGVDDAFYTAELNISALFAAQGGDVAYKPLPKYPSVTRDIAVVCRRTVTVGALTACIRKAGGQLLKKVELFDIYQGKGIAEDSKSVAFRLTIRSDERNIVAAEADEEVTTILDALKNELGAVLR